MILASKVFGGRIRLMPYCLVLALVIFGYSYYKNIGYIKHTENFRNRKAVEWLYKGVCRIIGVMDGNGDRGGMSKDGNEGIVPGNEKRP